MLLEHVVVVKVLPYNNNNMGGKDENKIITKVTTEEYKYGFVSNFESDTIECGLNKDVITLISRKKNEPKWMLEKRLQAFEILKKIGSQKLISKSLEKMNSKNFMDFESVDFTKKIFIYQKCFASSDLKKILKKNKDSITVLNPLMKIDSYKKKRSDELGLSFLSEMGYIFKIIKERTSSV